MWQTIQFFLKTHADFSKPLLLGISGGPDSLALLHLMLECRQQLPLQIGMAHIDHGWRSESKSEAAQLAVLAGELNIPFHLKTLNPALTQGNMEAFCRQERLSFFRELCCTHGYQAVALAHHADDLAETVLKRLFEGASILNLSGMRQVTILNGLQIWRPLLTFPKLALLPRAHELPLVPFCDSTNLDSRFLRGRLRAHLIPYLSDSFGKAISQPLCRLSEEALEARLYFDERIQPIMDKVERGAMGFFVDLSPFILNHPLELRHAIRMVAEKADLKMPVEFAKALVKLLVSGKADKKAELCRRCLHVDRCRLFIPFQQQALGMWKVEIAPIQYEGQEALTGWQHVWQGYLKVFLPVEKYCAEAPQQHKRYFKHSTLSQWWGDAKVPAFLRHLVPVIEKKGAIVHEFLTGRIGCQIKNGQQALQIICKI